MGKKCNIKAEVCGSKCTGYDGTMAKTVTVPKGSNAWDGLSKVIEEGVDCESCRDDGLKRISGLHDSVNLSIGERKKPFSPKNYKNYVDFTVCTWNSCVKRGDCDGKQYRN